MSSKFLVEIYLYIRDLFRMQIFPDHIDTYVQLHMYTVIFL